MATVRMLGSDGSVWEMLCADMNHADAKEMAELHMGSNGGKKTTWEIVEIIADSHFPADPADYPVNNEEKSNGIRTLAKENKKSGKS